MALLPPGLANATLEAAARGSGNPSALATSAAWLYDANVVRLDPGLIAGRSLTQRVVNGVAAWQQVVARGWPGEYTLVFTAVGRGPLAPLYQVGQWVWALVRGGFALVGAGLEDSPAPGQGLTVCQLMCYLSGH